MTYFPSSIPSISKNIDSSTRSMDPSGIGNDSLLSKITDELIAIATKVGVDGSSDVNSVDYLLHAGLYRAGLPRPLYKCGMPFVMFAGDGGSNGLSFTGTRGQFTLSAAILSGAYAMLSGFYAYLPAGAGGLTAGWYWGTMTDDTHGEIYADTYVHGVPSRVTSPTNNADLVSGRITQTAGSEITAVSFTYPGGAMGPNGFLRFLWKQVAPSSASGKQFAFKIGSTFLAYMSITTSSLDTDKEAVFQNAGIASAQIATRKNDGIGASSTSYSLDASSVDTSVDQTIVATIKLTANTDSAIFIPRLVTAVYGE